MKRDKLLAVMFILVALLCLGLGALLSLFFFKDFQGYLVGVFTGIVSTYFTIVGWCSWD